VTGCPPPVGCGGAGSLPPPPEHPVKTSKQLAATAALLILKCLDKTEPLLRQTELADRRVQSKVKVRTGVKKLSIRPIGERSLHRHGLCQVSRLIHIRALLDCRVICQHLDWQSVEDRRDEIIAIGHQNMPHRRLSGLLDSLLIGNQNYLAMTGGNLL